MSMIILTEKYIQVRCIDISNLAESSNYHSDTKLCLSEMITLWSLEKQLLNNSIALNKFCSSTDRNFFSVSR